MKKSSKNSGWSVHYSHIRPEPPHRWTRHGPLETEQAAIEVARLFQSQGLIVFAIHEGDDPRLDEGALRKRLTALEAERGPDISPGPSDFIGPGSGAGNHLEPEPRA